MKVLFITRKWPPAVGGMETYSYELCKAIEDQCDLHVLKLPGKENGAPPGPFSLMWFLLKSLIYVLLYGRRFDVIHIGDFVLAPIGFVSRLCAKNTKVLIMIHGLDILYGNRKGFLPKVYGVYQNLIIKVGCAHHFIANSENTGRLCKEANLLPVTVIPLGVNIDLPAVQNTVHDNSILFLGRLVTRKGALWFAENVLPHFNGQFRLKVVGKVWDESEQAGLVKCDHVDLVGYASNEDLFALKENCMVAVMPNQLSQNNTDVEGFGLVAAELSVQGVPVIASNIEGLTSAIIHEKTGFLIESDNIAEWLRQINEVAKWDTQKRASFCADCTAETKRYYSWERVSADTVNLYSRLTGQDLNDVYK